MYCVYNIKQVISRNLVQSIQAVSEQCFNTHERKTQVVSSPIMQFFISHFTYQVMKNCSSCSNVCSFNHPLPCRTKTLNLQFVCEKSSFDSTQFYPLPSSTYHFQHCRSDLLTLQFVIEISCFCYHAVFYHRTYGPCLKNYFLIQPGSHLASLNVSEIVWPFNLPFLKLVLEKLMIVFATMLYYSTKFIVSLIEIVL